MFASIVEMLDLILLIGVNYKWPVGSYIATLKFIQFATMLIAIKHSLANTIRGHSCMITKFRLAKPAAIKIAKFNTWLVNHYLA